MFTSKYGRRQLKSLVRVTLPFIALEDRNKWGSLRRKRGWESDAESLKSMCVHSSLCEYAREWARERETEEGRELAINNMNIQPAFFYFFLSIFYFHTCMLALGNWNFISFLLMINNWHLYMDVSHFCIWFWRKCSCALWGTLFKSFSDTFNDQAIHSFSVTLWKQCETMKKKYVMCLMKTYKRYKWN